MDTYGVIYRNTFDSLDPLENLLEAEDDSDSNLQFRLDVHLFGGMTYVLLITTHQLEETQAFMIVALGNSNVTLERLSEYIYVFVFRMHTQYKISSMVFRCNVFYFVNKECPKLRTTDIQTLSNNISIWAC